VRNRSDGIHHRLEKFLNRSVEIVECNGVVLHSNNPFPGNLAGMWTICKIRLISDEKLKRLHSHVQTLTFLPDIMRMPYKREPNRWVISISEQGKDVVPHDIDFFHGMSASFHLRYVKYGMAMQGYIRRNGLKRCQLSSDDFNEPIGVSIQIGRFTL
jgi:hypothetical protein